MSNFEQYGICSPLGIVGNATFASHHGEILVGAFQVYAPFARSLIFEQLWIHQGGVDSHVPVWPTMSRGCPQQCLEIVGRNDKREQITAQDHQAGSGAFATPGSPVGTDPFGCGSALRCKCECGLVEINANQLPIARTKGDQDPSGTTADLEDWTEGLPRHLLPIRQIGISGEGQISFVG